MAGSTRNEGGRFPSRWRIAPWAIAALLLLAPLAAMEFTDEVAWDGVDFLVMGVMLAVVCGAFELAARMTVNAAYRAAVGLVLAAAFILVWMNLAVGLIGTEGDPANLMYGGVLAVGLAGVLIARFRPHGMARALVATALAQALAAMVAAIAGMGYPASPPLEILGVNAVLAALWLGSAWLFWRSGSGAGPGTRSAAG